MPQTPLLDRVNFPSDLKEIDDRDLPELARELRDEMIDAVSKTGGHLGAGLGVVELTIAIHKVFNTPEDRLIFDVGHQCYPHKILTGRRDRIRTLRQEDGLSGFTRRAESEYDDFGAGHSSTSISAGLGMAVAAGLDGSDRKVIAVIGDGSMSAGMAFEALNNAGALDARLIVILNDNDMRVAAIRPGDRPFGGRHLRALYSRRHARRARRSSRFRPPQNGLKTAFEKGEPSCSEPSDLPPAQAFLPSRRC